LVLIEPLGDLGLGSFRLTPWLTRLAVSVSLSLLLSPVDAAAPRAKRPAPRKPAPVQRVEPVATEDDGPTIQLSAAKQRVHHEKPAKCEVWVDPERGFIDSCDAPQATAQGENTLEVITLDKGDWLEAVPEDENTEAAPAEAAAIDSTALEALPQVITSWAEPILDIVTLNLDSPSSDASAQPGAAPPPANVVEAVVQPVVQAVETLAQVVMPKPAEKPSEPVVSHVEPAPVVEANPMAQPSQPLAPIVFEPQVPIQAPTVAVEASSVLVQPAATVPPVVMVAVETTPPVQPQTQPEKPPMAVKTQQTQPAKPVKSGIQAQADSSSPKPSWRYRNQPKEQYDWPKNPVSRVLKGVVALIHWIFN